MIGATAPAARLRSFLPRFNSSSFRFRSPPESTPPAMRASKLLLGFLCLLPASRGDEFSLAATATNQTGLDLFRHLAPESAGANLLLSPYSIQSALAMTYVGAEGSTRTEMARALHFPPDDQALRKSFAALRDSLAEAARHSTLYATHVAEENNGRVDEIKWLLSNRLFGQLGYPFRETFVTGLRDDFQAPLQELDFRTEAEAARLKINAWVEEQTKAKIKQLVPAGGVSRDTRLLLVNALYFKAPWQNDFLPAATLPRPFRSSGREPGLVPTMKQTEHLGYAKRDGFTAVALPYIGGELQFLILLPDRPDGADKLARNLTAQTLADCARLPEEKIVLFLPRFRIEGRTIPLAKLLQTLGMNSAFDRPAGSADFSRMAPRNPSDYLALSEVYHQAYLALDENGTEASAATAVTMLTLGMELETRKPPEVHVDHPFLFAIQHRASGACLFLGRMNNPR